MDAIINKIRHELNNNIEHKVTKSFKEDVKILGVSSSVLQKISKSFFKIICDYPKNQIFEISEELWKSGYNEEAFIACHFSYYIHKQYTPDDFEIFDRWIKNYVSNWAMCDTLCNHTVGTFVEKYPEFIENLKTWARSDNRWVKRASAVSLIIPARRGFFLNDILEIADILLLDEDNLVQKGYGWMLKAASLTETFVKANDEIKKKHLEAVFNFVMKNKSIMPRTALRYAIEKMSKEMKIRAMEK